MLTAGGSARAHACSSSNMLQWTRRVEVSITAVWPGENRRMAWQGRCRRAAKDEKRVQWWVEGKAVSAMRRMVCDCSC